MTAQARTAFGDWASITVTQLAGIALGAVVVSLTTRLLGPEGYGGLAMASGLIQLLYVVGVSWTMAAAVRFVPAAAPGGGARAAVTWLCLPLASLAALAVLVALAARASWWPASAPAGMLMLLLTATTAARASENLLQAVGRMRLYAGLRLLGRAGQAAVLGAALAAGLAFGPWVVLGIAGTMLGAQALLAAPTIAGALRGPRGVDRALAGGMVAYSAPLLLRCSSGYALDWVDILALRLWRSAEELGVYHLAYQGMLILSELLAAVTTVVFPLLAGWRSRGDGAARVYAGEIVPRLAAAWAAITLLCGLVASLLVPVLFGEPFREAGRLCALLLAGAAFQGLAYLYLPVFGAYDAWGTATAILMAMGGVNLMVDVILVPAWGPSGAAAGTVSAYAVGAALYVAAGNRLLGRSGLSAVVPALLAALALPAIALGGLLAHTAATALAVVAIALWAHRRGLLRPLDPGLVASLGAGGAP